MCSKRDVFYHSSAPQSFAQCVACDRHQVILVSVFPSPLENSYSLQHLWVHWAIDAGVQTVMDSLLCKLPHPISATSVHQQRATIPSPFLQTEDTLTVVTRIVKYFGFSRQLWVALCDIWHKTCLLPALSLHRKVSDVIWKNSKRSNNKVLDVTWKNSKRSNNKVLDVTWKSSKRSNKKVLDVIWKNSKRSNNKVWDVTWKSSKRSNKKVLDVIRKSSKRSSKSVLDAFWKSSERSNKKFLDVTHARIKKVSTWTLLQRILRTQGSHTQGSRRCQHWRYHPPPPPPTHPPPKPQRNIQQLRKSARLHARFAPRWHKYDNMGLPLVIIYFERLGFFPQKKTFWDSPNLFSFVYPKMCLQQTLRISCACAREGYGSGSSRWCPNFDNS